MEALKVGELFHHFDSDTSPVEEGTRVRELLSVSVADGAASGRLANNNRQAACRA